MEQSRIEIIGIVNKGIDKTRIAETHYEQCSFYLESGEDIRCLGFIPEIDVGWKVKIIGTWSEDHNYISAQSVTKILEHEQLQLKDFLK
jgi:hypothetical protein